MPRIMNSVLFQARTHQIDDIPSAEMTERFGAEESPNACLLCHSKKDARWVGLTEPSQFGTSDAGKPFAFSKRSLKVSTTF
jgi:hypothetical protein